MLFGVRRFLRSRDIKELKFLEYLSLTIFLVTPLLGLEKDLAVNLSVTSLGCFIACLIYPQLLGYIKSDDLRQKKRALKKVPILFIVIFFTMSNHVELVYVYSFIGVGILLLKRNLAGAFFSWPLILSGFFENSAIMVALVTVSLTVGIYLLEDKNA